MLLLLCSVLVPHFFLLPHFFFVNLPFISLTHAVMVPLHMLFVLMIKSHEKLYNFIFFILFFFNDWTKTQSYCPLIPSLRSGNNNNNNNYVILQLEYCARVSSNSLSAQPITLIVSFFPIACISLVCPIANTSNTFQIGFKNRRFIFGFIILFCK